MVTLGVMNPEEVTSSSWEYEIPSKKVHSFEDMDLWQKSEAYYEYLGFITAMNEAVEGKHCQSANLASGRIEAIISLLDKLDTWTDEIPPIDQPQRFGNKAFRTWYERLKNSAEELLVAHLDKKYHQAIVEVKEYLIEGFGNSTRIDYGTGHEMSFCMFLCSLFKIGFLEPNDKTFVVTKVFSRYLEVVRKLQTIYKMEPAGSRGVWALDDFQFIPFIWGSSQLIGHPRISPSMFVQDEVISMYSNDYMFLGCIKFILQVKTGPFAEHSNQLWNISGVQTWEKINQGLFKMYKAEVLGKFPVVQHVLFGSLLKLKLADISLMKAAGGSGMRGGRGGRIPFRGVGAVRPPVLLSSSVDQLSLADGVDSSSTQMTKSEDEKREEFKN